MNHQVNYPLNRILIGMEDEGLISTDHLTTTFCVSFVMVNVAGLQLFVEAWNSHHIHVADKIAI